MFKFNIGDRVKADINNPSGNMKIRVGDHGTVRDISDTGSIIGVEWDNDVDGHTCRGACEHGHGWQMYYNEISLVEEEVDFEIEEKIFLEILKNM